MSFYHELKRRNVFPVCGVYLRFTWLLFEVAGTPLPGFGVPGWVFRFVVIVLALGFMPAFVFSWAHEIMPEGVKRDKEIDPSQSVSPQTGKRLDLAIMVALALSFAAQPVAAQDSGAKVLVLEEVIVTANKRETSLQELPMSVGVVSEDQLKEAGMLRLEQYWRSIPSLSVIEGPLGGSNVIVRGLADGDGFLISESLAAFYQDDTPLTYIGGLFATAGEPTLIDVNRVEVLRGPQGTLIGANSMGGAIRIITNEPDVDSASQWVESLISSTAHGGGSFQVNAVLNQPLNKGRSGIRLATYYHDTGGFLDDIGLGQDNVNDQQDTGARLSISGRLGQSVELLARVQFQDRETGGYDYQDPVGKPELGLNTGPYQTALLVDESRQEELTLASLRMTWEADWGELVSASSWFKKEVDFIIDGSPELYLGGFIQGVSGFYFPVFFDVVARQEDLSQELRLAGTFSDRSDWLLGAFYLNQKGDGVNQIHATGLNDFCGNCAPFLGPDELITNIWNQATREDIAIFGEFSLGFAERWETTLGARWYSIDQSSERSGFFADFPVNATVSGNSNGFVGKSSLSWNITEDSMVYALASTGFRPGQFNRAPAVRFCGASPVLDSDRLLNYELGAKTRLLDDRMSLNVTAYRIDWSEIQISSFGVDCGFVFLANAGEAVSEGLELEFNALVSEQFSLQGGFGLTDAHLTQAAPALNAPAGTRIPNVPRFTASLAATFRFPLGNGVDGFFRADAQFVSSRKTFFDPDAFEGMEKVKELPSYGLLNLRTGIERDGWRAELFADNVFDERGDLFCCRIAVETVVTRPRTIGLRASYQF